MNGVILFDTFDARTELKLLQDHLKTEQEQKSLKDLQKFMLQKEDFSWILDDKLHALIAESLKNGHEEVKIRILRVLSICALKDNFINFLNLDRKSRCIMSYASKFNQISNLNEQKALAMLICNLFSNSQTSSYALYFSQWTSENCLELSTNAQIVVNLAIDCLQSSNPNLRLYGSGIMFNISLRQVRVLEKPENEKITDLNNANLECEDISHSDFSEKKGSVVALKAYDDLVLDICSSLWQTITEVKDLDPEVLSCCLKTLKNLIHMLDFPDGELAEELKNLSANRDLNAKNSQLIQEILAQV